MASLRGPRRAAAGLALALAAFAACGRGGDVPPVPAELHRLEQLGSRHVRHRERVIATHFWYPPQLIPLVEVCASPATAPEVVQWTCDAVRACGKEPAVIERELPGFIGNRLQFALLREAWSLWASGAASAEAIDACVRMTIGRRLGITGPIESADIGGIATMDSFARGLLPHLDVSPGPPAELGTAAARGGVYDWSERDADALRAARRVPEQARPALSAEPSPSVAVALGAVDPAQAALLDEDEVLPTHRGGREHVPAPAPAFDAPAREDVPQRSAHLEADSAAEAAPGGTKLSTHGRFRAARSRSDRDSAR